MSKKVVIYTTDYCGYCRMAKKLMGERGVEFEEILLQSTASPEFQTLMQKTGMRTVPQIFADDQLIGGYQELSQLDVRDQLRSLKD